MRRKRGERVVRLLIDKMKMVADNLSQRKMTNHRMDEREKSEQRIVIKKIVKKVDEIE